MKSLKRIGLYGISGTGKTTILKAVGAATNEVIWLQGSNMVLKAANVSLPEFKRLSARKRYHFREQAILNAVQIQIEQNKHVIIDAHLAFLSDNGGFENAMTRQEEEFYTDYLYLNLPAIVIHRRLLNDTARPRSRSVAILQSWIEHEMAALKKFCQSNGSTLTILENDDLNSTVQFICQYVARTNVNESDKH